jgi:ADP-ribosylglycohydrolase
MAARYRGCLLGGAVGDALGAPVEFLRHDEILARFGEGGIRDYIPAYGRLGAITDDTQMTLFSAEGVLRAYLRWSLRGICHPPSVIHYAYLRWLRTQGVPVPESSPKRGKKLLCGWLIRQKKLFARRAPGGTCIDALGRDLVVGDPARNDSKGCGGVMRVAPIGMFFHSLTQTDRAARVENYQRAFDLACEAAGLTHGHPTGQLTAGVMAALVFDLLDGVGLQAAIDRVFPLLQARDRHDETMAAIRQAVALSQTDASPAEAIGRLGEGWIAEEALAIGLYCALKATDIEAGVIMAVNHDGDSDSTGLIAGHLLGAIHGVSAIPARWLDPLELREVIEAVADDLATAGRWRLDDWNDPDAMAEEAYYVERYPPG